MSTTFKEYQYEYEPVAEEDWEEYWLDDNKFTQLPWEDLRGMTVTSGSVTLTKDEKNLIGISIGGGAPLCPCLYVVQIFDNTPAAKEATLQSGDELVGVNGQSMKVLKKAKHRVVESLNSNTADALGLSRAILCNDGLVKKLQELERTAETYKGLIEHAKKLLKATFDLSHSHKAFGEVFSSIGVREPQPAAKVKSYCLKVKEMDDEEYSYAALQEPLYRVETGNYEYRLVLRCRQEARIKFAKMRSDVLVKLELLDQKHVQDIVFQLQRFVSGMAKYHSDCHAVMKDAIVFPIEVDLSRGTFTYDTSQQFNDEEEDEEESHIDTGMEFSGDLISTD
ncbi:PICK1-like protein [Mya arenaria]|uniref:PRKCA-binding protein n=1 Tax=Mya arenaria TaxID=6604 RepID=A0ABY7DHP0_MYAAR|nr:PICK1-like protein [Mya arenaria]